MIAVNEHKSSKSGAKVAAPEVDRGKFWNQKILEWENDRYDDRVMRSSFLEVFAFSAGKSLRHRMQYARKLLAPVCSGKRIVEFGCGTGRLAASLIEAGAQHYLGIDISSEAIDAARDRALNDGINERANFLVSDILSAPPGQADIVFSLGLIDWLSDHEIEALFSKFSDADYLHSFSEERSTISQRIHKAYVYLAYGHRSKNYVPSYHESDKLKSIAAHSAKKQALVYRHPKLSFGTFLTNLSTDGL